MDQSAIWHQRAEAVRFNTGQFIGGDFLPCAAGEPFRTENPATREPLAEFRDAAPTDVDKAVRAARIAAEGAWGRCAPARRKHLLVRLSDLMLEHREELALLDCLEMGKPISNALADVASAADFVRYNAELADKIAGNLAATGTESTLAMTFTEPWGVVGAIVPWNYPMVTASCALAPALAAGNSVVLKPSEYSPSSALRIASLAAEAGLPDGALNVIVGRGHVTGEALARHPDVDKLHFTGSQRVGRHLMICSGESNGKPVMLETGGKSPQIVFADATDVPDLGPALALSAFANSGQLCVARTRLLVERGAEDAVREALTAGIGQFRSGDPLAESVNFGPIASERQFDTVSGYLQTAGEENLEAWETAWPDSASGPGFYVPPTVFGNVGPASRLAREEIFGPVLAVTTFGSEEEALKLANGVDYGLAATVWTRDLGRGRRLSHALKAGRVDIRGSAAAGASLAELAAEPFGASGFGPLGGIAGLRAYTRHKGVQFITD